MTETRQFEGFARFHAALAVAVFALSFPPFYDDVAEKGGMSWHYTSMWSGLGDGRSVDVLLVLLLVASLVLASLNAEFSPAVIPVVIFGAVQCLVITNGALAGGPASMSDAGTAAAAIAGLAAVLAAIHAGMLIADHRRSADA